MPTNLAAVNITPYTADITWEGFANSYTLRYSDMSALLNEGFEDGEMPEGWTIEGDNQDQNKTWRVGVGNQNATTGTHSGNYNALITHNSNNEVTYLVTPALNLGEYGSAELSFWYVNKKWSNDTDEFAVCYRIGNEGEWHELWSTAENHNTWTSQSVALTGLDNNCQIGFRFTDHYGYGVALDDIDISDPTHFDWITVSEAESPHTLTGLTPETEYEVQVKSNCTGNEDWSESIVFTTLETCSVPFNVEVSGLTATSATVSWTGFSDFYNLSYRRAPGTQPEILFSEGFEGYTLPHDWTIEGDNQDQENTWRVDVGDEEYSTGTHSGFHNALITHNSRNEVTYLVMPALDLGEYSSAEISFWYINRIWKNDFDEFAVCYRIGNEDEWHELWSTAGNHEAWTSQSVELTGLASNYQIGFRFTDHWGWGVGLDDIAISDMAPFQWTTLVEIESPHTLTGLMPETEYEVKVRGYCEGELTDWSASAYFTTQSFVELVNDDSGLENGAKNSAVISANATSKVDVKLAGRTLFKDGEWNTICLPFNLTDGDETDNLTFSGTPLEGAIVKTLSSSRLESSVVRLSFSNPALTSIVAGTPYIIKWNKAEGYDNADPATRDIFEPVFTGVTINAELDPVSITGIVDFIGYYDAFGITAADDYIYYMTAGSILRHTANNRTLKSCRAYFDFTALKPAGTAREFILDFGDGETTSISEKGIVNSEEFAPATWYTIDGKKLDSAPTRKGVYINNGTKVVIK